MDSEKSALTVKRKFQEGKSGQRDRWWFLIKGSETTLRELENLWSCVSLQVGWKLETCTKPGNDNEINASERVDATPNELIGESINEALNVSNNSSSPTNGNSPAPTNANNPLTSELPRSSQLINDKQRDCVDVNTSNPSQSVSHSRHQSPASSASVSSDNVF